MVRVDRWNGFGTLADATGNTREGLRDLREEMRDGFPERIEEMDDP